MRITVRVPATSANLGPGFDCLGLALELCNEVTADPGASPAVTWEGEGASELPTDGSDMVSRSLAFAADRLGVATPPVAIHGRNAVPLERGLGSSSAAAVAGIVLAAALAGDDPELGTVFELAAAFEGHPDNAAPAVLGGVTIAAGAGPPVRLDPHPGLRPVVLVPERARLPTEDARRALPPSVPLADAVANLGHTALTVIGLTRDPSLLPRALDDRLHQGVRLALVPEVKAVFDGLRSSGVPVCVSGAGPSLLVLRSDDAPVPSPGPGWRVLEPSVRARGFDLERA